MKKTLGLFVLAVLIIAGCGGESSQPAASEAPASEPAAAASAADEDPLLAEGKALFAGTAICYTCHGAAGEGSDLAPNLTDDEWLNIEAPADIDKLVALIKVGVPEPKEHPGMMPPMGHLSEDQLRAIATYVLSLSTS